MIDGADMNGLRSAVSSWNANGQKNGWAASDPTTQTGFADIMNNGLNAKGMVNIPVCSLAEAVNNVQTGSSTTNWPCN
jgi:hypothetical protein